MKIATFSLSAIVSLAIAKGDTTGLRSANSAEPPVLKESNETTGSTAGDILLVDYVYTYGAPAVAKHPHHANPGNKCIPGIRVYTENVNSQGDITNTDFAAHLNAKYGYGHPKISTLALRNVDGGKTEYYWWECKDSDNKDYYDWEWYPNMWSAARIIGHIHSLREEYEPRLTSFLNHSSIPLGDTATELALQDSLQDYISVPWCNGKTKEDSIDCLDNYSELKYDDEGNPYPNSDHGGLTGVKPKGWEVDATMNHRNELYNDNDYVYTLKNDNDPSFRKCIISFQQSQELADFGSFMFGNELTTGYCGRTGVHIGLRNELWQVSRSLQHSYSL